MVVLNRGVSIYDASERNGTKSRRDASGLSVNATKSDNMNNRKFILIKLLAVPGEANIIHGLV